MESVSPGLKCRFRILAKVKHLVIGIAFIHTVITGDFCSMLAMSAIAFCASGVKRFRKRRFQRVYTSSSQSREASRLQIVAPGLRLSFNRLSCPSGRCKFKRLRHRGLALTSLILIRFRLSRLLATNVQGLAASSLMPIGIVRHQDPSALRTSGYLALPAEEMRQSRPVQ